MERVGVRNDERSYLFDFPKYFWHELRERKFECLHLAGQTGGALVRLVDRRAIAFVLGVLAVVAVGETGGGEAQNVLVHRLHLVERKLHQQVVKLLHTVHHHRMVVVRLEDVAKHGDPLLHQNFVVLVADLDQQTEQLVHVVAVALQRVNEQNDDSFDLQHQPGVLAVAAVCAQRGDHRLQRVVPDRV